MSVVFFMNKLLNFSSRSSAEVKHKDINFMLNDAKKNHIDRVTKIIGQAL